MNPRRRCQLLVAFMLATAFGAGCIAALAVPPGARIACEQSFDCPAGFACATDGHCIDAEGPCAVALGDGVGAAVDGLPCPLDSGETSTGICVAGACIVPFCGDGFRDPLADEECDFGSANSDTIAGRCRTDCRAPRCGDGVVDGDEGCDNDNAQCVNCQVVCPALRADCDNRDTCECGLAPLAGLNIKRVFTMAMDDDTLYLGATGDAFDIMGLLAFDLDSGAITTVLDEGDEIGDLVVGTTKIAFRSGIDLRVVNKSGGPSTTLHELFSDLAMDGDDIYTFDDIDGVLRFQNGAGPAQQVGPPIRTVGSGAVIDGVPYAATGAGDVVRVRRDGLDVLATRQFDVTSVELVADQGALWWLDERGQLIRLAPTGGGAVIAGRSPPNLDGLRRQDFTIHDGHYAWRVASATGFDEVVVGGQAPSGPRMRARPDSVVDVVAVRSGLLCFSSFDDVYCLR